MNENTVKTTSVTDNAEKKILPDECIFSTDGTGTRINSNVIVLATSGRGKARSTVVPDIFTKRN